MRSRTTAGAKARAASVPARVFPAVKVFSSVQLPFPAVLAKLSYSATNKVHNWDCQLFFLHATAVAAIFSSRVAASRAPVWRRTSQAHIVLALSEQET